MDKVCVVVGAGNATGGAVARRFAREGFVACIARRSSEKLLPLKEKIEADGGRAIPFALDARREEQVVEFFAKVEREVGPVEVAVFNVGGNIRFGILETPWQKYYKSWEQCAGAGFLVGREAARAMLPRGRGTILFTGATASLRGGAGFAAFAGGKHALRALAQSMARELGPQGIHVAHVVVDGMIDTEFTAQRVDDPAAKRREGALLDPEHIAESYWHLYRQPRTAWTHELDLRPWVERW